MGGSGNKFSEVMESRTRLVSTVLGVYAAVGGLLSFAGWAFGVRRLVDWDGSGIAIQPNTCIAITLFGFSVLLIRRHGPAAALLAVAGGAIGALSLFQNIFHVDLGVNTVLTFGRPWDVQGTVYPALMGVPASISFTLLGAAVVLLTRESLKARGVAIGVLMLPLALSLLSITGYIFGATPLTTIPRLTAIALQTATFVLAVSLGALATRHDHAPMRLMVEDGPAGILVRRAVPAIVLVPIALGFLRIAGEEAGLFGLSFGTAARSVIETILMLGLLFWTARLISAATANTNEVMAALRTSETELRSARDDLEERVAARTQELARSNVALLDEAERRVVVEQKRIELLRRLITGQEAERQRIGRDIHDHLGQRLTALRLQLESLKAAMQDDPSGQTARFRVETLDELARILDAEVSYLAWELRPTVLDQFGLVETLRLFVDEWSKQFGVSAEFQTVKLDGMAFDKETETHLYRITQEALHNVAKHASAKSVAVQLARQPEGVSLVIEDDGCGFTVNGSPKGSGTGGLGLVGMRERAELIGGDLQIESERGTGTTLFVRVPLNGRH